MNDNITNHSLRQDALHVVTGLAVVAAVITVAFGFYVLLSAIFGKGAKSPK